MRDVEVSAAPVETDLTGSPDGFPLVVGFTELLILAEILPMLDADGSADDMKAPELLTMLEELTTEDVPALLETPVVPEAVALREVPAPDMLALDAPDTALEVDPALTEEPEMVETPDELVAPTPEDVPALLIVTEASELSRMLDPLTLAPDDMLCMLDMPEPLAPEGIGDAFAPEDVAAVLDALETSEVPPIEVVPALLKEGTVLLLLELGTLDELAVTVPEAFD